MRPLVPILLLALAACESGTSEYITVDLSAPLARDASPEAPLLLRTDAGSELLAILCGQVLREPAELSIDHGFGCLADEDRGARERRTAWLEPAPDAWDLEALCALPEPDPGWRGISVGPEITGHDNTFTEDLALEPDPDWPQGTGSGVWKRDASPCGGNLRVEIAIPV